MSGSSKRARILLLQPHLDGAGGGTAVGAFIAETLVAEHAVTLLTMRAPDYGELNRRFGTALQSSDFEATVALRVSDLLIRLAPFARMAKLEWSLLLRRARQLAPRFDLIVSASNEVDVGRRAVQYVHFPAGYYPRPEEDLRWFHGIPASLTAYYAIASRIAPITRAGAAGNRTLVNSAWTGEKFQEMYGTPATVVHPPIPGPAGPPVSWADRRNGFAVVGRLAPEKRLLEIIRVLERVRSLGHPVTLTIIGTIPEDSPGRGYARLVRSEAAQHDWIEVLCDLSRADLLETIGSTRYGIHGMLEEHFGMSVAEMARAGCIVFVPDGGGQTEIVPAPELRYRSIDDAVAKIVRVLEDEHLQRTLREASMRHAATFTIEAFREQVSAIVREELNRSR